MSKSWKKNLWRGTAAVGVLAALLLLMSLPYSYFDGYSNVIGQHAPWMAPSGTHLRLDLLLRPATVPRASASLTILVGVLLLFAVRWVLGGLSRGLFVLSGCFGLAGVTWFLLARTSIHEIQSLLLLGIAAILLVGGILVVAVSRRPPEDSP